jgi:hypothetical protein
MLPYIVIFAAILFFVIRGLGWLDEFADWQNQRGRGTSRRVRGKAASNEEARRLEVYKQFLERKEEPPDEVKPG